MGSASLSVGAFGDEVAELQSKLLAYGYALPPGEIERKFFGPATREAVQKFQAEHGVKYPIV